MGYSTSRAKKRQNCSFLVTGFFMGGPFTIKIETKGISPTGADWDGSMETRTREAIEHWIPESARVQSVRRTDGGEEVQERLQRVPNPPNADYEKSKQQVVMEPKSHPAVLS
jgi:hypothetical protein